MDVDPGTKIHFGGAGCRLAGQVGTDASIAPGSAAFGFASGLALSPPTHPKSIASLCLLLVQSPSPGRFPSFLAFLLLRTRSTVPFSPSLFSGLLTLRPRTLCASLASFPSHRSDLYCCGFVKSIILRFLFFHLWVRLSVVGFSLNSVPTTVATHSGHDTTTPRQFSPVTSFQHHPPSSGTVLSF